MGNLFRQSFRNLAMLIFSALAGGVFAQTWNGTYSIIPASAPAMVLEVAGSGTADGTVVSLGSPDGAPNQAWAITPAGNNLYSIKPSYSTALALAADRGGSNNKTPVILETNQQKPWQLWEIKQNANGTCSLFPSHALNKALDNLGGHKEPGSKQDIWDYNPANLNLQWRIKPLDGTPPTVSATNLQESGVILPGDVPQLKLPQDAPQGVIKELTFNDSRIFPGTRRNVWVFIPAQYDGSKPACVFLRTDGYNLKLQQKPLLEGLIAGGYMPVTIGVFVSPGALPAPINGTLSRFNRCLEYDGMGDDNVRFFTEELLPFVGKELGLNLSTNGNDRCIAGGSSGGITAFNAAWERPDAFSRVYCCSGSFVAFRGGNEFPTLVRKTEAKSVRAYLTTGTHDMENCAGDWFLLNQEMDKALKFSGYDYKFRILEGGHGAGNKECFTEAMAFVWKDWPKPVQAGPSAPRVQAVILPGETWQLVAEGYRDARGAACNAAGDVFFTDEPANKLYCIGTGGQVKEFLSDAGHANDVTVGLQEELYTVSGQTGKVMQYTPDGKGRLVIDGLYGRSIMADPHGGLYVTCPGKQKGEPSTVWFVKDGQKTQVESGLKEATGLAYRPDQWLLSVADGASKWVYSYQINADGTLTNKERFFWLHVPDGEDDAGAGSVCYAKEGQMFVATRMGIQVCADDGPTQVILPMPDRSRVLGVCLGGTGGDTLFALCGDKIWKRKVKTHAIGAFSPWIKVAHTPL